MQTSDNISFWDSKPLWCQPWTITLTGISLFAISIILPIPFYLKLIPIIIIVSWMILFLFLVPKAYIASKDNSDIT